MAATLRTPGEIREIAESLRALGVVKAKIGDLEFEFGQLGYPVVVDQPPVHLSPEDYEQKAKDIRKQLDAEVYAAS